MDELSTYLQSTFKLSPEESGIFLASFSRVELKKNGLFAQQGQICHQIGLIAKGLMKCTYHRNGTEVVFEFAYGHSFIADYYSFLTQTPSEKEIRCLEDTTVYTISRTALEKLATAHPFVLAMSEKMNENLFLRMHNRLTSLLLETPTERYQKLIAERRDLSERIPQYLLASYLNVKPETVSRIRKKITAKPFLD